MKRRFWAFLAACLFCFLCTPQHTFAAEKEVTLLTGIDFEEQKKVNADIYAWIAIPDTKIDYPVLQHPTENDYYLSYNLDGTKGYPGCIYTQLYNAKDFSDFNTVLYGHNMKNGDMFAHLHKFADKDFFDGHPYIYIYLPGRRYTYQVFGAYQYDDRNILLSFDFSKEKVRTAYIGSIKKLKSGNFRWDIMPTQDSNIITLSTCIGGKPYNRYLVQGVLVAVEDTVLAQNGDSSATAEVPVSMEK